MSEKDFSTRIYNLRKQHQLTLEDVAQQVGVGRSTVRKWETGMIENLRRDKIAKLAAALHTTPAYLMGWNDPSLLANQVGFWDGTRLADERNSRGYSISQISSLLEISEDEYKRLESGSSEPSFKLILRMADIFGCDLDYICHRTAKINGSSTPTLSITSPATADFSEDESELIRKFRCLDDRGQAAVLNVLNHEYDSLPGEKAGSPAKEA